MLTVSADRSAIKVKKPRWAPTVLTSATHVRIMPYYARRGQIVIIWQICNVTHLLITLIHVYEINKGKKNRKSSSDKDFRNEIRNRRGWDSNPPSFSQPQGKGGFWQSRKVFKSIQKVIIHAIEQYRQVLLARFECFSCIFSSFILIYSTYPFSACLSIYCFSIFI